MTKEEKIKLLQENGCDIQYTKQGKTIKIQSILGQPYAQNTAAAQLQAWIKVDELCAELTQKEETEELQISDDPNEPALPFMKELDEYIVSKQRLLELLDVLVNYSDHRIDYTEVAQKIIWERIDGLKIKKDKWTQNWATGMILTFYAQWIDALKCPGMEAFRTPTEDSIAMDWDEFNEKILKK